MQNLVLKKLVGLVLLFGWFSLLVIVVILGKLCRMVWICGVIFVVLLNEMVYGIVVCIYSVFLFRCGMNFVLMCGISSSDVFSIIIEVSMVLCVWVRQKFSFFMYIDLIVLNVWLCCLCMFLCMNYEYSIGSSVSVMMSELIRVKIIVLVIGLNSVLDGFERMQIGVKFIMIIVIVQNSGWLIFVVVVWIIVSMLVCLFF